MYYIRWKRGKILRGSLKSGGQALDGEKIQGDEPPPILIASIRPEEGIKLELQKKKGGRELVKLSISRRKG